VDAWAPRTGAAGEEPGLGGSRFPKEGHHRERTFKGLPVTRAGTRGYPREEESAWAGAGIPARSAVHLLCANMRS